MHVRVGLHVIVTGLRLDLTAILQRSPDVLAGFCGRKRTAEEKRRETKGRERT